jgi:hypothetical protein
MKPSISRDVHYVSYGTPGGEFPSVCRAAKVTEVNPDNPTHVGLARAGRAVTSAARPA